jgi:hypothetical protein
MEEVITMALKDLEGKRTGRPRGAKSTSRVRRDILWAYNHLDKPDAKPPSPGAKMWAKLARKEPVRFLAHVARNEAPRKVQSKQPGNEAKGTGGEKQGKTKGSGVIYDPYSLK